MKKIVLFILMMLPVAVFGQDVIVTKAGDVITGFDIEIGTSQVFYRSDDSPNSVIKCISRNEVLSINRKDGKKELLSPSIGEEDNNNQDSKRINKKKIENFNNTQQISFIGEPEQKDAKYIYGLLSIGSNSKILDDNVEISVDIRSADIEAPHIAQRNTYNHVKGAVSDNIVAGVILKNKTDRIIYIDLANSFFTRNESSVPYYIPKATSNVTGKSTGTTVNMGAIADAIGIGGSLGTLANGVNMGSTNSSSTETITYSQRIISIPPYSSRTLDYQFLFPENMNKVYGENFLHQEKNTLHCYFSKGARLKIGEERSFREENSPVKIGSIVTYAFDEAMSKPQSLNLNLYTSKMIGCKYSKLWWDTGAISKNQFPEKFRNLISFCAWQEK